MTALDALRESNDEVHPVSESAVAVVKEATDLLLSVSELGLSQQQKDALLEAIQALNRLSNAFYADKQEGNSLHRKPSEKDYWAHDIENESPGEES